MGGTYPRTENDDYDRKLVKHAKRSERRRKAMERSLVKNMKRHAEYIRYLHETFGGDLLKLSAKFADEAARRDYFEQAQDGTPYETPEIDMSRIDDVEISVYQQKHGEGIRPPEEISDEVLAKLEILDENNNLPNYEEFSSMPEYANMSAEERAEAYLEYRQGLISKMKAEREEGSNLTGFEADPTGRPLTKAEQAQQYRNLNQVMQKGFSNKALEELASHGVDTTQMIDPEQENMTVSKEVDIKMFLFKAKDGGIAGLVETEDGTYVTPSRYEGVEEIMDGKTLEEAMRKPSQKVGKDYHTVTGNSEDLEKGCNEIKAWTAMLEQEGVHCEFLNRYNAQYTDGVNADFREKGITHLFNTGDDSTGEIGGKIEAMLHDSFNETKATFGTFKNDEITYYWEKIDEKKPGFCSQIVDHINERSSDVTGFKATSLGEKTIRIDVTKEGFERSFVINFKQLDLKGDKNVV